MQPGRFGDAEIERVVDATRRRLQRKAEAMAVAAAAPISISSLTCRRCGAAPVLTGPDAFGVFIPAGQNTLAYCSSACLCADRIWPWVFAPA
jgi:hypothetical protein